MLEDKLKDLSPEQIEAYGKLVGRKEQWRTVRAIVVTIVIVLGVLGSLGIVKQILDVPPWIQGTTIVAGILSSYLKYRQKYLQLTTAIQRVAARNKKLEESIDPNRSSSSLNPDGTDSDDD